MPPFDCLFIFPYNQAMIDIALRAELKNALIKQELPGAGWSYGLAPTQAALEPTCLALLALRWDSSPAHALGLEFLLGMQNPNGSWPAFRGDDCEGSGLTALAVIALINNGEMALQTERGVEWLLRLKGRESHWLWRWKFETTDTHVRFDPNKFGWPWLPGTCSWVIPTALSIIALKQGFVCCKPEQVSFRIRRGKEMLQDRVCPGGGWNAGNGVVYGVPLAPHLDATAVALLALGGEQSNGAIASGLDWLERRAGTCSAPWSLAWSILALDAYGRPVEGLLARLCTPSDKGFLADSATLAAVILAIDCLVEGNVFKVIA
ncbi:MAG: prenyltransferase/squalene oxidase repeat-containing protein [Terriglobia bacterium]